MKIRESGMPEKNIWNSFFDPEMILTELGLTTEIGDTVDFGCGYGTFAFPAARRIHGKLFGFDIDQVMIKKSKQLAKQKGLQNVYFKQRDFMTNGTGLNNNSIEYVMLFNIFHVQDLFCMLEEVWRILMPKGKVGVIHWNYNFSTPRGPSISIRPRPEDCKHWLIKTGFEIEKGIMNLPPYHYGLLAKKGDDPHKKNI